MHCGQRKYLIWFHLVRIFKVCFFGLCLRVIHVLRKKMSILQPLDEVFWKKTVRSIFSIGQIKSDICWYSVWMIYPMLKVRYLNLQLLLYWGLPLSLTLTVDIIFLYFWVLQCWVCRDLQLYSLAKLTHLLWCNNLLCLLYSFCLAFYFIWYKYNYFNLFFF